MKNYADFEMMEPVRPFRIRKSETEFGWYWLTRSMASLKATGGNWFQFSLFLSMQIVLFALAFLTDSLFYVSVHAFKSLSALLLFLFKQLYEAFLKAALKPILWLLAVCFAVILIYALYKLGLWSQLLNFLLNYLQQWHW